jgi:aspartate-semialdehyde dehydrogenase
MEFNTECILGSIKPLKSCIFAPLKNNAKNMKIALVGATGMVGTEMLQVIQESPVLKHAEIIPAASEKSVGKTVQCNGKSYPVVSIEEACQSKADFALFSAGGSLSKEWAPRFAHAGITVIDNSSAWRMEKDIPLCVPEINADSVRPEDKIIANPNCSTIQLVMALAPLHREFEIERLVISTYQSVSGTGKKAVDQMNAERSGKEADAVYPHPIDKNCLPHCDIFLDNGYTKEEMKLVHETRKILNDPSIRITATAVRVPVDGGHSESVNIAFKKPFTLSRVKELLDSTPGVVVQDDVANNIYPMPLMAKGKNDVFVGRLRRDESQENGLNAWIVSDNLRKGAATNAVQIAEHLVQAQLVTKD